MAGFNPPTELELRTEYADMMILYAEEGVSAVESHIMAKGRLEMQHLLVFLFVRCLSADIKLHKLQEASSAQDAN